jgi:protein-tyrosine phosphatase
MLDIHSHIIFGIDDGAKTIEDSIKLLHQAIDQDIDHIIATPHYNDFIKKDFFEKRDAHCAEIMEYAKSNALNIDIEYGCEISFQIDWDRFNHFDECAIREKYLLLEFSDIEIPDNVMETIFSIRKKGFIPIIAHPERSYKIQDDVEIVKELHRLGCLFQLDAGSLKNHFGKDAMKTAQKFMKMNLYHFVGSDAHSPRGRSYRVFEDIHIQDFQNHRLKSNEAIQEQTLVEINSDNIFTKLINRFKKY